MVITTTSAAALAAGSTLADVDAAERSDAMLWLTLMAGGFMIAAALVNLGRYIRFVSYSVMLGFLTGVAVNMVFGQLPDLLGAETDGGVALQKAWYVVTHPSGIDLADGPVRRRRAGRSWCCSPAPGSAPSARWWRCWCRPSPSGSPGWSASRWSRTTARCRRASRPPAYPTPARSASRWSSAPSRSRPSCWSRARAWPRRCPTPTAAAPPRGGDFTAQGVGNLASGLFGGQVVGGSVGQSALNVTAGARSRWAAIFSGIWMLAILLVFSELVGEVAMATLAAVLIYAGWGTIKPREIWSVAHAGPDPGDRDDGDLPGRPAAAGRRRPSASASSRRC